MAEEAVFGDRGAAQTGDGGNPGEQVELKPGDRRASVASGGSIDSEENQVLAAVAKFYLAEFGEAADKKPGGNKENHGNGYLGDDQDFSCRKATVGRLA